MPFFYYSLSALKLIVSYNKKVISLYWAIDTDIYFFIQIKYLYRFCTTK